MHRSGDTEMWVIESLGVSDMLRLLSGSCVYVCVLEPLILSLPSPRFICAEIHYFISIYTVYPAILEAKTRPWCSTPFLVPWHPKTVVCIFCYSTCSHTTTVPSQRGWSLGKIKRGEVTVIGEDLVLNLEY